MWGDRFPLQSVRVRRRGGAGGKDGPPVTKQDGSSSEWYTRESENETAEGNVEFD